MHTYKHIYIYIYVYIYTVNYWYVCVWHAMHCHIALYSARRHRDIFSCFIWGCGSKFTNYKLKQHLDFPNTIEVHPSGKMCYTMIRLFNEITVGESIAKSPHGCYPNLCWAAKVLHVPIWRHTIHPHSLQLNIQTHVHAIRTCREGDIICVYIYIYIRIYIYI